MRTQNTSRAPVASALAIAILTLSLTAGGVAAMSLRGPGGGAYQGPRIDPGIGNGPVHRPIDPGIGGGYAMKKSGTSHIAGPGAGGPDPQPRTPTWKNNQGGLLGGVWPPPRPHPCSAPGYHIPPYCP